MQDREMSKSSLLMQIIRKPQIAISVVVAGILVGCGGGGGGSTPAATTSYTVSVVDDNIVGSTLTAAGCTSSTDNKNGTYTLSGCSAQPALITATSGFIDTNGNGSLDANESTQDSPLVLRTAQSTGTTFNVTPLTTLTYGLSTAEIATLKAKLGGIDLFGKEEANKELRQTVNALLAGATESGLDVKTFGVVLAQQINNSTATGVAGIKDAVATIKANPSLLETAFGKVKITGFLSDGRVDAVRTGANAMTAMVAAKVPDGKIRISGFIYDDIIADATVVAKIGDTVLGTTTAGADGRYTFTIDRTSIPAGKTLQFIATLDKAGTGEDIKLTSLISTDKLLASMVNSKTNASTMGDLIVSNVTTVKAVIAEQLNPDVLTDGKTLESTMLTVESGYADTVVKVAGEIKYVIDSSGTTGTIADTLAYAKSLVTSTGGTTGIVTDHSSLVTGDVVLNAQLSTELTVPKPTAVNGIAASKAMIQELRTQALSLVNYNKNGALGSAEIKAAEVGLKTRDIVGINGNGIERFINIMGNFDATAMPMEMPLNTPINLITVTPVTGTTGYNYTNRYGTHYYITVVGGGSYWWMDQNIHDFIVSNDVPYSLSVTKTAAHGYSYTLTNADNSNKVYTGSGTFSKSGPVSMVGDLPGTRVLNNVTVHTKLAANIVGSITTSGNTDSITYSGTLKKYKEGTSANTLDSSFTLTSAKYNVIHNTTTGAAVIEPVSIDGFYEMSTYTLSGKITASDYIDVDSGYGVMIHIPKNVMFDGKALDTDGSYISGLVNGSITNSITNINNALFDVSFTGKLNVPSRPLTTVILTMKNIDADKANVTFSYTYDKTKIDIVGVVADKGTVNDVNKYTLQLKNQAGVTIDVTSDTMGKNVIGTVSKDGINIGTINMLSTVPRVTYYDGTFETLI